MTNATITTGQIVDALIRSESLRAWVRTFMGTAKATWQRGEAVEGMRGAVALAVGATRDVQIRIGKTKVETAIIVDGHSLSLRFLFY